MQREQQRHGIRTARERNGHAQAGAELRCVESKRGTHALMIKTELESWDREARDAHYELEKIGIDTVHLCS